jgi:hypothetical protein
MPSLRHVYSCAAVVSPWHSFLGFCTALLLTLVPALCCAVVVLQGEFIKDQMGLEHLSHHFLPLLRYRRQKYRKQIGYYPPELSAVPVKAKLVV